MRNIRLTLAYDGTDYVGWQVQPNGLSVQEVVERAIGRLTGEEVKLLAAGRTDSGVHALGQVASFETNSTIPCDNLRAALQKFLPDDVVVREAAEVPAGFHATYSAKRKRYRYVIHNSRIRDPFVSRYAWHYRGHLDDAAMHQGAQRLLGTHDFRCFESHFPNKATSVRTVMETRVARHSGWPLWSTGAESQGPRAEGPDSGPQPSAPGSSPIGDFVWFDIVADGFLYNMVRAIVGTLVEIGRGRWQPDEIHTIIDSQDRSHAGDTAPPQGLYLVGVDYE